MKGKSRLGRGNGFGYALLAPATLMLLVMSVYPLLSGFWLSMTNRHLMKPKQNDFVFLENYITLMHDKEFFGTLAFTFAYTFCVVAISYVAGLALALALNRNVPCRGFFRAVFLIPWVIPPVVAIINWSYILNDQFGIINIVLQGLGIIDKPILFLGDYALIRPTVILVSAWKQMPFMMITLLAGLQSIPKELYEAAEMDGSGFWNSVRHVTLPMLKPITFISTLLSFVWTFNSFENVWLLTAGGPNGHTFTLPILSYYTAFFRQKIAYASTIASTMVVVMMVLSIIYFRFQFRDDREPKVRKGRLKNT